MPLVIVQRKSKHSVVGTCPKCAVTVLVSLGKMSLGLFRKAQGAEVLHLHTFPSEFIDKVAPFRYHPYISFPPGFGHLLDGAERKRFQRGEVVVETDCMVGQVVQPESCPFL